VVKPQIYLASSSPRRHELLEQIGIGYQLLDVNIDEQRHGHEAAEMYVLRMALGKARSGWVSVRDEAPLPVLGADTVVFIDDEILGKPADRDEAGQMLAKLSNRTHYIYTGVALDSDDEKTRLSVSNVTFRELDDLECRVYCASEEVLDKAGAYAIQERAAVFISRIEGSYSGVMGLPLFETAELLAEVGIHIFPGADSE
jgi:septum formation protein